MEIASLEGRGYKKALAERAGLLTSKIIMGKYRQKLIQG